MIMNGQVTELNMIFKAKCIFYFPRLH